ncbi:PCMD domain-containing protein [Flammeovirga aprica]|uniref:Putative carbohydrate metabolism domain-containing protein n=1 Tax=Flammeovirga aprica JL-4 TaxID=694437 RepID=A0A7X9S167_9BACT|nr:PCMD domain-containing protein [Flammeovirga aprica]NME72510.1 hypothetical protein [Flammeovirga aprica JL-4]
MKIFNSLLTILLISVFLYSCSSDDSTPPPVEELHFEENLSLDTWTEPDGYPKPSGWETSNAGTIIVGTVNASEEKTDVVSGSSAKLETVKVIFTGIAASTFYTGAFQYNSSDPANSAILGVPFTKRPKSMSFHYKYTPGQTYEQYTNTTPTTLTGLDSCLAYMFLQKREGDKIERVGTAAMQNSDTVTEWTKKTLNVQYGEIVNPEPGFRLRSDETGWADANATPTHVIIVFTSSSAGDFFRGAIGSTMYVDEISIEY